MDFAQNLKRIMGERNLTAYRVAKDLELHQTTVSNWLTGKSIPGIAILVKLAKYLEMEESRLLGTGEIGSDKKKNLRSIARLEDNTFSEEEDEQISDFISYVLSKRNRKK